MHLIVTILFSYSTPVAAEIIKPNSQIHYLVLADRISPTTTKHINSFLARNHVTHTSDCVHIVTAQGIANLLKVQYNPTQD
jgi:hypothetical protein